MLMMMMMQSSDRPEQLKQVIEHLQESLPMDEQKKINLVMDDINHLSVAKRYLLAASTNVCGMKVVDCRGLPHDTVKTVVSVSLDEQKYERESDNARKNFYMSIGSFGISFASLILSFLAFRRKAKEPSKTQDTES